MKAVILAGGLGTRLKPFTEIIPKPLLPIGEKSVLQIQIEHLKESGFNEIFLATNYKSDYISNFFGDGSRFGIKLKISKEEKQLGTVGPLSIIKNELYKPFLVINGDVLTLFDYRKLIEFSANKDTLLTVCTKEIITPFEFGDIVFEGDFVIKIEEKPKFRNHILAGIYFFKPEIFNYIPYNEYYGIDTLIKNMLDKNLKILKYEIKEYWLDIGRVDDYREAQEIYRKHFHKG